MKNKKQKISKIIFVLMILIPTINYSQVKLAQTGLQFLEIGMSPRAEAMGGAYVISGNDADALFYNPAGIARVNSTYDIIFNRVQWFADINYNAVGITYKPYSGLYGTFGLSILSADYGDFYGTTVAFGTPAGYINTGVFSPKAFAIGLSYGKQLTDRFSIGGQVKYLDQTLGSNIITAGGPALKNEVSGLAFDFGMIYSTPIRGFDFGMTINNFAQDFEYQQYEFEAPLTFRVGVSFNVFELAGMSDSDQKLLIVADAIHPRDYSEHLDLGAEYTFYKMFSFRVGYKVNYSEQGFTAGIGMNYDIFTNINLRVSYAYEAFGIWDNVQLFSVGFSL